MVPDREFIFHERLNCGREIYEMYLSYPSLIYPFSSVCKVFYMVLETQFIRILRRTGNLGMT